MKAASLAKSVGLKKALLAAAGIGAAVQYTGHHGDGAQPVRAPPPLQQPLRAQLKSIHALTRPPRST
jgi:hypothetical protein